jgi:hypothetical protein
MPLACVGAGWVGPSSVWERSPIESSAEAMLSLASQRSTTSITSLTARDPHSERTRTSLRRRSNESEEGPNSCASPRIRPWALFGSATATQISTIRSSDRSVVADQKI